MILTVTYFWLIKIVFMAITLFSFYKAFKTRKKLWLVLSGVLVLLSVYSPIKLDLNTKKYQQQTNYKIEQQKILPKKEVDDSFEKAQNKIKKITKEEIWK